MGILRREARWHGSHQVMDNDVQDRRSNTGMEASGASVDDPILQACGLSAAEILARCARLRVIRRAGGHVVDGLAVTELSLARPLGRTAWRMVDFGEGSQRAFVQAAYFVLLGRMPHESEAMRRLTRLSAGGTRLEVILLLALSSEGRRRKQPPVAGFLLPIILKSIRIAERIARARLVAPIQRAMRVLFTGRHS